MPKKFKYDKPLAQIDPDAGMLSTDLSIPSQPQPGPKIPGVSPVQQSQGRIDLPTARKALKSLQAKSQTYFNINKRGMK